MEKDTSIWKNSMNWGLIIGIVLIIYSLLMYFLGFSLEKWVSYLSYLLIVGGIVYSTIQYRDNVLGGSITYGKALGFGTLVILFAAIVSAVYTYLFYTYIDPEMINKILEMTEEEMVNKGMPDEQIEMALKMQSKFMKPWLMALFSIPTITFTGFILSLFTSIFLKKEVESSPFD